MFSSKCVCCGKVGFNQPWFNAVKFWERLREEGFFNIYYSHVIASHSIGGYMYMYILWYLWSGIQNETCICLTFAMCTFAKCDAVFIIYCSHFVVLTNASTLSEPLKCSNSTWHVRLLLLVVSNMIFVQRRFLASFNIS